MTDVSNSKSFRRSFSIKTAGLNKKMNKLINTTPKRMKGRPNVPPPLNLEPLTPPPTVQQPKRQNNDFQLDSPFLGTAHPYNLDEEEEEEGTIEDDDSPTFQIKHNKTNNKSQNKSFLKNICCFCEEPLRNTLVGEKVLELSCDHQSHYNCYLLLINREDISDFPQCCICGIKAKPVDENIIEDLYSKSLTQGEDEDGDYEEELIVDSPTRQHTTPYTPQDKIINNCNSAGFQSPNTNSMNCKKSGLSSLIAASSTYSPDFSSPQYSVEDLMRPNINVIPEFNKINATDHDEEVSFGNVLNIFTTQLHDESTDVDTMRELKLKHDINDKVLENFRAQIHDTKGINFNELSKLRIFDFIEISLDGLNWEFVQVFIFTNILLLLNEEGDTIIGTIMLKQHYSKIFKLNEHSLMLYFTTATLPELQIRSMNKILISKWEDFFQNKLVTELDVPVMQITTNAWELVDDDDGSIEIPKEIIQFNELTSKGLDLPFQTMKNVLPKPKPLPICLIMAVSLMNTTGLSDDEYLSNIKRLIRTSLSEISGDDRFGLVILGRDGNRQDGKVGTFCGMVNSSWSGWEEIISELQISQTEVGIVEEMKIGLETVEKLVSTIPDLNYEELEINSVRKLVVVSGNMITDEDDYCGTVHLNEKLLTKVLIDYKFSLHQVVIGSKYTTKHQEMIDLFHGFKDHHQYTFSRFDQFGDLISEMNSIYKDMKKVMIPNFHIDLKIVSDFIKLEKIEQNGTMKNSQAVKSQSIYINDLDDGFHKNLKFNISIDLDKLKAQRWFQYNQFIELPILNYHYSFSKGNPHTGVFKIKLQIHETRSSTSVSRAPVPVPVQVPAAESSSLMISPINSSFGEELEFLDIPLLPPLSSFKDSIYVKKQIELLILERLDKSVGGQGIDELISLIFGLIRGCSTNYITYYKDSNFNKFKNFNLYVDLLIMILNQLKKTEENFDTMKRDFSNSLKMDGYDLKKLCI